MIKKQDIICPGEEVYIKVKIEDVLIRHTGKISYYITLAHDDHMKAYTDKNGPWEVDESYFIELPCSE